MTAVLRYELALLARSHRWLPPALLYAVLVAAGSGAIGQMTLGESLGWSSAMLVPAVGLLTRSALTDEPDAARACVATVAGPRRTQLAALCAGLTGGIILAVLGSVFELLVTPQPPHSPPVMGSLVVAGVSSVTCLLIGSAIGALCNPPLIRHPAYALLSTSAIAVLAIVVSGSPANAALRATSSVSQKPHPPVPEAGLALIFVAVAWAMSVTAAARRGS